jgi:Mg2+ and Co2+ transporter CorA
MFYPTIQLRPRIALKMKTDDGSGEAVDGRRFPQSANLLPQHYGRFMDKKVMASDPYYAMDELFKFYTFSFSQFLNIMERTINNETARSSTHLEKPTLKNLLYYQQILEARLPDLQRNIVALQRYDHSKWLNGSKKKDQHWRAKAAAESNLHDMEHLEHQAKVLLKRCKSGMSVLMNYVMLAESRQAMSQSRKVARLTLLAFLYIPLSFTCSLFGMNVKELALNKLSVWVWVITAVPVLLISVLAFYFDFMKVRLFFRRVVGQAHGNVQGLV